MKKSCFIFLLAAPMLLNAQQQHFQVGVYSGYTLPAVLKVNVGRYRTEASMNYGVTVSMSVNDWKGVATRVHLEMQYNHQSSELRYKKYSTDSVYNIGDIDVNTILMGATTDFTSTQVKPYAGILGGVTFLNGGTAFPGIARFTMSLVGGAKIALTSYAGLRMQAQLLMPVIYNNVDVGWEPTSGVTNGIAPNGVVMCANFSGGIYIQFK